MGEKFWILDNLEQFLLRLNFGQNVTSFIIFVLITAILAAAIKVINLLIKKLVRTIVQSRHIKLPMHVKNDITQTKVLGRTLNFLMIVIIHELITTLYQGFSEPVVSFMRHLTIIGAVIVFTLVLMSAIDIIGIRYDLKHSRKTHSIKGFLQTIRLILWIIAVLVCFTLATNSSLTKVLTGLTAFAAVLMLVFKDTILGLVASIQLASNDSVRIGDWIVTADGAASGTVAEVNLTYVKVKNTDNTVTYVPAYNLVSQTYTNWREMYAAGMRKLNNISVTVDTNFIRILDAEETGRITSHPLVRPYAEEMRKLNGEEPATNLTLYRTYMERYLGGRKEIADAAGNTVLYLAHNAQGLTLTANTFTSITDYAAFMHLQCNILEHMVAMAPVFGIVICQQGTQTLPNGETVKIS